MRFSTYNKNSNQELVKIVNKNTSISKYCVTFCLLRIRVHSTKMQVVHEQQGLLIIFVTLTLHHHQQHSWKSDQFIREH